MAEADRFFNNSKHRATLPVIDSLQRELEEPKQAELQRLFNELPDLDSQSREQLESTMGKEL